jgi:hypothetical protein
MKYTEGIVKTMPFFFIVYIEIVDKIGLPRYRAETRLVYGKTEVYIANLATGIYIANSVPSQEGALLVLQLSHTAVWHIYFFEIGRYCEF